MQSGNILDTYIDSKKNVVVTWLTNNGKSFRIEDSFEPSFFVYSSKSDLYKLASVLQDLPQVKKLNFTLGKTLLGSKQEKFVLEVFPKNIGGVGRLAKMIDSWGAYHRYNLYNVDIRLPSRYLYHKGVFCNARARWDGKKFLCNDSQWSVDYPSPLYKKSYFYIKRNMKKPIKSYDDKIESIKVDKEIISEENEADTILSAVKCIQKIDPDILFVQKGDSVLLPFLYHRAKLHNIQNKVNLGRDENQRLRPVKKAKSYFSYGQIVYRPDFYTLCGRAHIDTHNSFLYSESKLSGLIDISRCSNIPLQYLSRVGPGTAISQMQVNRSLKKGYLVPWKKNTPEDWKTAMDLLVSDRGGLIFEPSVGLHDDVVELDFASLYPNIMLKFNISPETMMCSCCKNSYIRVPQLGYHICINQKGLLPEILEEIIDRRFLYKARSKNKKNDQDLYIALQQAWKWVLLVCFGYTGYRNARYGRIECYESITAYSRDILLTAKESAEKAGYIVLHGIIDSLWVKPFSKNPQNPANLSRTISKNTGIKMDVEGHYKWIVFLPSKQFNVGALTRYYGIFDNDELKIRGIELRQRNCPLFLKNMQKEILEVFSKANNSEEFLNLIPSAVKVIKEYGKKIIQGDFNKKDLILSTCVSKGITDYKVNNVVKSALIQLRDVGVEPQAGQSVRYIVCNEASRNYKNRVCIAELLDEDKEVDVNYYLRHIAKCGESILTPFDYSLEKLYKILQKIKNREKINVSILS